MNATSLYVTTSRLILQNDGNNKNLSDLYRLLPYLRQSLACKVCGHLLVEPHSPSNAKCQHNVCRQCIGERKNLKTTCTWCWDKQNYVENRQLRILLQCYKSLCEHVTVTPLYQEIRKNMVVLNSGVKPESGKTSSVLDLIDEGAKFQDNFNTQTGGLSKSAYSILPCLYTTTNSSTHATMNNSNNKFVLGTTMTTSTPIATPVPVTPPSITTTPTTAIVRKVNEIENYTGFQQKTVQLTQAQPIQTQQIALSQFQTIQPQQIPHLTTCPSVYSVLYAGSGNKITIKRKMDNTPHLSLTPTSSLTLSSSSSSSSVSPANQLTTPITSITTTNFKRPQLTTVTPQFQTPNTIFKQQKMIGTSVVQPVQTTINSLNVGGGSVSGMGVGVGSGTTSPSNILKRKGCRCGNATLTPGKLTCCGQRCPCYVESKSCIDCKCRGCRNPHHPNGFKVRPHLISRSVSAPIGGQQHTTAVLAAATSSTNLSMPVTSVGPTTYFINDLNQLQFTSGADLNTGTTTITNNRKFTSHFITSGIPTISSTNSLVNSIRPISSVSNPQPVGIQHGNTMIATQSQFSNALTSTLASLSSSAPSMPSTIYTTNQTNFNQLLNNTIIFNPADIPTAIIDGGSIQSAEISIDL